MAGHVLAGYLTGDWGMMASLLTVAIFGLALAPRYWAERPGKAFWWYPAGYAALFVFLVLLSGEPLVFVLFAMLYVALYRYPIALAYLGIVIFATMVVTPYWFQTAVLCSAGLTLLLLVARRAKNSFLVGSLAVGLILLGAVLLPLFYMGLQSPLQTLLVTMKESLFSQALVNSLATATLSTLLVLLLGVPLGYALARSDFRGKETLDALIDLPILVPQSVAGIALLALMGPKAPLGAFMEGQFGFKIAASYAGIIACQVFVSSPFLIRSAMSAFEQMGPRLEYVSRTLGAPPSSTFFRVSLPLAANAIFAGSILTWARAMSEVGSVMIVAYHPMTVSVMAYDRFVQYGLLETQPVATLLLLSCLWVFIVLRWMRAHPPRFFVRRAEAVTAS